MATFGRLGTHVWNTMKMVGMKKPQSYADLIETVVELDTILHCTDKYLCAHADKLKIKHKPGDVLHAGHFFAKSLATRIEESEKPKDQRLLEELAPKIDYSEQDTSLGAVRSMFKGIGEFLTEMSGRPVDFSPAEAPLIVRTMKGPIFDWKTFVGVMRASWKDPKYVLMRREEDGLLVLGVNDPNEGRHGVYHNGLLKTTMPKDGCVYELIGAGILQRVWSEDKMLEKMWVTGQSTYFPTDDNSVRDSDGLLRGAQLAEDGGRLAVIQLLQQALGSKVEVADVYDKLKARDAG